MIGGNAPDPAAGTITGYQPVPAGPGGRAGGRHRAEYRGDRPKGSPRAGPRGGTGKDPAAAPLPGVNATGGVAGLTALTSAGRNRVVPAIPDHKPVSRVESRAGR